MSDRDLCHTIEVYPAEFAGHRGGSARGGEG